jgi:hypothetical protein
MWILGGAALERCGSCCQFECCFSRLRSAPSAPAQPHPQYNSREQRSTKLPSITDRNKPSLLLANLDHAQRNNANSAATSTAFAACARIAHPASPRTRAAPIHHFCHRNNRLSVCCDRLAINRLHARLAKNTFLQGLQKSHTAHTDLLERKHYPTGSPM